ncbi:hypothetical protein KFE25_009804 [Diacronema lutheri]|uniref:Uncharacterized protein n=1 Tax=Diacronema lutheri TaxID=2081491 RepID=A0A8J5X7G9_DIALT|nr:hypothetical protein KFE25_009804 [Diacronema lutheri]
MGTERRHLAALLVLLARASFARRSPLERHSPCGAGADELLAPTGTVAFRSRLSTPLVREWTIAPLRAPARIALALEGARVECAGGDGCSLAVYEGEPRVGAAELLRLPRTGAPPPPKASLTAESSSAVIVLVVGAGVSSVDISFKASYTAYGIAPAAVAASEPPASSAAVDAGAPSVWHDGFYEKALDIPRTWADASASAVVGAQCGAAGESGRALVFGGPHAQPPVATSALLQLPPGSILQFTMRVGTPASAGGDPSGACGPGSGGALVSWAPAGRGPSGPFDSLIELGARLPDARNANCFAAWSDVTVPLPARGAELASVRWASVRPPGAVASTSALWAIDEVRVRAYGSPDPTGGDAIVAAIGWASARHAVVVAAGSACVDEAVRDGSRCDLKVVLADVRGEPRGPLPADASAGAVQAWVGSAAVWRAWPFGAYGGAGAPSGAMRPLRVVTTSDGSYGVELGVLSADALPGLVPARGSSEAAQAAAADPDGAVARLAVAVLVAGQHAAGSPFQVVVLPATPPVDPDSPGGTDPGSANGTCACECSGAAPAAVRGARGPTYYVGLLGGGLLLVALLSAILFALVVLQRTKRLEAAAARAGGYASFEGGAAVGAGTVRRVGGGEPRPARRALGGGASGEAGGAGAAVLAGATAAAAGAAAMLSVAARGAASALSRARGRSASRQGWARGPAGGVGGAGRPAGLGARGGAAGSLEEQREAMSFFATTAAAETLRAPPPSEVRGGADEHAVGSSLGLIQPAQPGLVASPFRPLPSLPPVRPPPPPPAGERATEAVMESGSEGSEPES